MSGSCGLFYRKKRENFEGKCAWHNRISKQHSRCLDKKVECGSRKMISSRAGCRVAAVPKTLQALSKVFHYLAQFRFYILALYAYAWTSHFLFAMLVFYNWLNNKCQKSSRKRGHSLFTSSANTICNSLRHLILLSKPHVEIGLIPCSFLVWKNTVKALWKANRVIWYLGNRDVVKMDLPTYQIYIVCLVLFKTFWNLCATSFNLSVLAKVWFMRNGRETPLRWF